MPGVAFTQVATRFRNDDGGEAAATWLSAQDAHANVSVDVNVRLRVAVSCQAVAWGSQEAGLLFSHNGGAYTLITTSSPVARASESTHFTDGETTTQQLITGGLFAAGAMDETGLVAPPAFIDANRVTEFEFCFQIVGADVANGDTIDFRLYRNSGTTALQVYSFTPRGTVIESPPSGRVVLVGHGGFVGYPRGLAG